MISVIKMGNEKLITYCGLYCGDCYGYQGKIASLAGKLNEELNNANFKKNADHFATLPFFKEFKNYDSFVKLLKTLEGLTCEGCRDGGGPPFCEIRKCCGEKEIMGCWECGEFKSCEKLNFLSATHGDAHIKNLDVIKEKGMEKFIDGDRHW
jgi:hypothetical protein